MTLPLCRNFAAALAFAFLTLPCVGQFIPTFTNGQQYHTGGTQPFGVAVGDLNGDGIPDLVVVNQDNSTVGVLFGKGDGTFQSPVVYDLSPEPSLENVVVADFNHDGRLDVAVSSIRTGNQGGNVLVLLNQGNGLLAQPIISPGAVTPEQMLAADLNQDKKMDLLIGANGSALVLYGNGDGTFQAPSSLPCPGNGSACLGVAVADFNRDGRLDVVEAGNGTPAAFMSVLLQNLDGSFTPSLTYSLSPAFFQNCSGVAAGDTNSDGLADVVVSCYGSGKGASFFGNGDGTFRPPVTFTVSSGAGNMLLADFNHDGNLDLEFGNFLTPTFGVSVFANPGNGLFTFHEAAFLTTTGGTAQVAYGDFNVDGYPDVVSADSTGGVLSVFLNTTGPFTVPLTVASTAGGVVVSGDGFIRCGQACLHNYPTGTTVILTAKPDVGATFVNWSGCASPQHNVCRMKINSALSVAASFAPATVNFSSLVFSPSSVRKGKFSTGTLTFSQPAPAGGITLRVTSSHPSLVSVPATIYVPGNATTYKFSAKAVTLKPSSALITVTDGTTSVSDTVHVVSY